MPGCLKCFDEMMKALKDNPERQEPDAEDDRD